MERQKSFFLKTLSSIFSPKPKAEWGQGRIVWDRFTKNPLAVSAMVLLIAFACIAFLGANIRPDKSEHANQQILEIALQKPGFTVGLYYPNGIPAKEKTFFSGLFFGSRVSYHEVLPIYRWWEENQSIYLELYTGDNEREQGEVLVFGSAENKKIEQYWVEKTFWLGTDNYGRDVLSRLMAGSLVSILVGIISVLISLVLGITLGALAGYFGGWYDTIIMWVINVVWSIPTFLMVMAITLSFGKGFIVVFIAVGLTMWVEVARVVRGQVLSIKEKEFVEAAKSMGFTHSRIILLHILPNILGPVIVISAANFATAILLEAGLSFLGIGTQIPTPSWGNMIKSTYTYITTDLAYLALLPGFCITFMVLCFMVMGNALRDAMDSRAN
ncbi:MAG: ABC transporter permease [Luteibaculaceae bacterium]